MGDFDVNILNCENGKDTSEFIDLMYASSFYPTINTPTRMTNTFKTLADNIFYNCLTKDVMSGNITISISDHLFLTSSKSLLQMRGTKNYCKQTRETKSDIKKLYSVVV